MVNLSHFVFFDDTSTTATSNTLQTFGGADQLTLQVDSADGTNVDLIVEGKTDVESNNWVTLAVISLTTFANETSITSNGIYAISTLGINAVRIVNNGTVGSVKVYGVLGQ